MMIHPTIDSNCYMDNVSNANISDLVAHYLTRSVFMVVLFRCYALALAKPVKVTSRITSFQSPTDCITVL